ncbi:MAG: two-component system OmpR family response regulator [Moritella sp.]|jgi:two-component system OmpR family response regulator
MNTKKQILVVDDDIEIKELLSEYLEQAGFSVLTAGGGKEMQRILAVNDPDIIVLDVMMPGDDGFTLCQKIRRTSQVPIIMLTANSDEADRIVGLEIGADDYMAKPFSPRELQARIKALLRRSSYTKPTHGRYFTFSHWRLDTLTRELLNLTDNTTTALSGSEFNMLKLFVTNPNQVLDRDALSDATRGRESLPLERGIDIQLSRLRQKLGDNSKSPSLIKTIRGSGYVLITEVTYED